MPVTRTLKGVINSFLDTFVSRYSAYDGYWLFGVLVPELTTFCVDLLNPPSDSRPHFQRAIQLAARKFREQAHKGKIDLQMLRVAKLTMSRREEPIPFEVSGFATEAWPLTVSVAAEDLRGRRHLAEQVLLVARHNPAVERRSRTQVV